MANPYRLPIPLLLINKLKMEKWVLKFMMFAMVFLIAGHSMSQTIIVGDPINSSSSWFGVAYIDSNHPSVSLSLNTPSAGIPVQTVANSDLFLRTSVYQKFYSQWAFGYIQAQISSGSVPPGTILTIASAPCTTTDSGGTLGNPTGIVTLSNSNQNIVSNISTSYTGTGNMDGYQITFALNPSNYGQIVAGSYNVTVMFTVSP